MELLGLTLTKSAREQRRSMMGALMSLKVLRWKLWRSSRGKKWRDVEDGERFENLRILYEFEGLEKLGRIFLFDPQDFWVSCKLGLIGFVKKREV